MLDAPLLGLLAPPLDRAGRRLADLGVSANAVTIAGWAASAAAAALLAGGNYGAALGAILLSRLADGLDGAVARARGPSDFGGYLDIVGDFLFYAAVPFGFAIAEPSFALPAACLLFAFVGTGSTFLAFAILAAKRGVTGAARGPKSFYYLGGLTEGTETIALFVLACLWPAAFPALAYLFSGLSWITTATRIVEAWRTFGR
jgi:phosphatidylglycerophosphate synthase